MECNLFGQNLIHTFLPTKTWQMLQNNGNMYATCMRISADKISFIPYRFLKLWHKHKKPNF